MLLLERSSSTSLGKAVLSGQCAREGLPGHVQGLQLAQLLSCRHDILDGSCTDRGSILVHSGVLGGQRAREGLPGHILGPAACAAAMTFSMDPADVTAFSAVQEFDWRQKANIRTGSIASFAPAGAFAALDSPPGSHRQSAAFLCMHCTPHATCNALTHGQAQKTFHTDTCPPCRSRDAGDACCAP